MGLWFWVEGRCRAEHTAGPSTSLRSGRDDNFVCEVEVAGMKKERLVFALIRGGGNCRSLGCARDDKGEGDASMKNGC